MDIWQVWQGQTCDHYIFKPCQGFDTLNHQILLNKFYKYGIRGIAFNLLKSYSSDWLQTVKVNNVTSTSQNIVIGVPQGTILGSLLFLVFINNLLEIMSDDNIVSNADDTGSFIK